VVLLTGFVEIRNVAVVEPAEIVTLAGTVATETLLLERFTTAPPAGAGPVRVTVPTEDVPPLRLDGFSVNEESVAGTTVNVAVAVAPP
jgi:hypothetical protein